MHGLRISSHHRFRPSTFWGDLLQSTSNYNWLQKKKGVASEGKKSSSREWSGTYLVLKCSMTILGMVNYQQMYSQVRTYVTYVALYTHGYRGSHLVKNKKV